jgi:hypothetical protein
VTPVPRPRFMYIFRLRVGERGVRETKGGHVIDHGIIVSGVRETKGGRMRESVESGRWRVVNSPLHSIVSPPPTMFAP